MPLPPPLNSHEVYRGHHLTMYEWDQALFDGSVAKYECVTRPDSTAVLAFLDPKTILLTRQTQSSYDRPFVDLPGGRPERGEALEDAALREFEEETGYRCGRFTEWYRHARLGDYRFERGLYLATDLTNNGTTHFDPGEKIEIFQASWDELVAMCLRGEMRQIPVMFEILRMHYDMETSARLRAWLSSH